MFILPIPEPIFGKIAFSKTTKDISSRVKGVGVGVGGGEGGVAGKVNGWRRGLEDPKRVSQLLRIYALQVIPLGSLTEVCLGTFPQGRT